MTRAQIFVGAKGVSLYKGHDGHPDNVMPVIVAALEHLHKKGEVWNPDHILSSIISAFTIRDEILRQARLLELPKDYWLREYHRSPQNPYYSLVEEVQAGIEYIYVVRRGGLRQGDRKARVEVLQPSCFIERGTSLAKALGVSTPLKWASLGEGKVHLRVMRSYYRGSSWGRLVKMMLRELSASSPQPLPRAS
jgi:hypothetical protein